MGPEAVQVKRELRADAGVCACKVEQQQEQRTPVRGLQQQHQPLLHPTTRSNTPQPLQREVTHRLVALALGLPPPPPVAGDLSAFARALSCDCTVRSVARVLQCTLQHGLSSLRCCDHPRLRACCCSSVSCVGSCARRASAAFLSAHRFSTCASRCIMRLLP